MDFSPSLNMSSKYFSEKISFGYGSEYKYDWGSFENRGSSFRATYQRANRPGETLINCLKGYKNWCVVSYHVPGMLSIFKIFRRNGTAR